MRMPWNQPALRAYNMHSSGYKARDRPRKRWIRSFKEQIEPKKISMAEATQLAIRREGFLCDASRLVDDDDDIMAFHIYHTSD